MRRIILALLCLGAAIPAFAQQSPLTPKYLAAGQYICEDEPWKLVFEDNFEGDTLKSPWIRFNSWCGMSWQGVHNKDHPYWSQGRFQKIHIYKDENVYVSNGAVKLMFKREETSTDTNFTLPNPPKAHAHYSSGMIALPYFIDGTDHGFNNGAFEARIKMPKFKFAHSTMWLWPGANPADQHHPETDIAEAYGVGKNGSLFGDHPRCNFQIHNWPPPEGKNAYSLKKEQTRPIRTHDGAWGDWFFGNLFDISDWHTYRLEWDSTTVRWFVDGLINFQLWKFYHQAPYKKWFLPWKTYYYKQYSVCDVSQSDDWSIEPAFPYYEDSKSQLRFTTAIDKVNLTVGDDGLMDTSQTNGSELLGQMEIDYVKIWQRRLHHGWTDLNGPPPAVIDGPDIICDVEHYTATPPGSVGAWDASASANIWLQGDRAGADVHWSSYAARTDAVFGYSPDDLHNPTRSTYKTVDAGKSAYSIAMVSKTISGEDCYYQLSASGARQSATDIQLVPYQSPHTFEWSVDYGPGRSLHHHAFGQYISVPPFPNPAGQDQVHWTLKITNACGSVTLEGTETFAGFKVMNPERDADHAPGFAFVARIDDPEAYSNAVQERLNYTYLPENATDVEISSAIEKVELEELASYLVLDSPARRGTRTAINAPQPPSPLLANTTVFPVPAHRHLNIRLSTRYAEGQPVHVQLSDPAGRVISTQSLVYQAGAGLAMDVSNAAPGFYHLMVQQGSRQERVAVVVQPE